MATIHITLKSRKKRDDTFPVVLRIRHNKQYFDIPTNLSISRSKFDKKHHRIIDNIPVSNHVEELKEKYSKRLREFVSDHINREFDLPELKAFILNKSQKEVTIKEFWDQNIEQLISSGRTGSAKIYKDTYNILSKIIPLNVPFSSIGIKDLLAIEKAMRLRGNNWNSIGVKMRTLRTVFNKAIQHELVDYEWYPFRKYKIRKGKTIPRVLSLEEIQTYFKADIKPDSPLYKVWNVGKLLFMLRGINLRDLLFLTNDNIKSGRIIYQRGKTGKMYSIKLIPEILGVIQTFQHDRKSILGMMLDNHIDNPANSINSRYQVSKRINIKLKLIGQELGFVEPLTTYVFRYSYANIARRLGFSKDHISEALGHSFGNTVTNIYLELFDLEELDKMDAEIIKTVTNQTHYPNQSS